MLRITLRNILCLLAVPFVWSTDVQASDHWDDSRNCLNALDQPFETLPGGSIIDDVRLPNPIDADYKFQYGGLLRLQIAPTDKVNVFGETYDEAIQDLLTRRPLQEQYDMTGEDGFVAADVLLNYGFDIQIEKRAYSDVFKFTEDGLVTTLSAQIRLADWVGYDYADAASKRRWDNYLCHTFHHEIGHILLTAQIIEEMAPQWSFITAKTEEEFRAIMMGEAEVLRQRISEGHSDYHDYIDKMGPELAESRPYLELPFPWLMRDN